MKKRKEKKEKKKSNRMVTVGRGLEDLLKLPWIVNGHPVEEDNE